MLPLKKANLTELDRFNMKLTKEELFTLKSVLQIAKVHINNDAVCAEYAGKTSEEIDFFIAKVHINKEILNLQKRIDKALVRRHKQSFKKSKVEPSDDWVDYLDDGQPDEAQEWHDFDPDC